MFSASRLCAPSQHIRRRLFHLTSQPKEQSGNSEQSAREGVRDEIREDVGKEGQKNVQEETQEKDLFIYTYTRPGGKRYVIMPTAEQHRLQRLVMLQRHKQRRRDSRQLNAFTTEPLDEATLDERAGLNTTPASHTRNPKVLPFEQRLIAVKDNISSSHFPTTCASQMLDGYKSPYNATVVKDLEACGAIVIGKTNMDEFGMGSHSTNSKYGAVKRMKPWAKYSAGGSSGGSAVAVATERCGMALGTDTGGSVRLPAAYTATIGFKPSYGRFSRWGLVPYANSLDTIGIICSPNIKSPRQASNTLSSIFRYMRSDPSVDPDPTLLTKSSRSRLKGAQTRHKGLNQKTQEEAKKSSQVQNTSRSWRAKVPIRFGVPVEYNTHELSPSVRLVWQHLLENLQAQGHKIVPISLPSTKHALSAYYIIAAAEAASNLAKYDGVRYGHRSKTSDGAGGVLYAKTRGKGFGNEVQRRILLGSYTLSSKAIDNYFLQAQKIRRLVQQDFDRVFALPNGLHEAEPVNLSELDENISLENKTGPAQVDLIICPTAPTLPPKISEITAQSFTEAYMNDVFTVPTSLAGLPAISIPVFSKGWSVEAGMQIIGQYFDDEFVVEIAERISYAISNGNNFKSLKVPMRV